MNTFIRDDLEYDEAIENVFKMVSDLPNDKLKKNYSKENLKVDEWIGVSLFAGGFSSIAYRDIWNNNCRILNRFYKKPEYRFENKNRRISEETLDMIEQQLHAAKILGFDCAFMSRETKTQAFHHYKKHLPQKWYTPKDKYKMWNTGYQYVMWTSLNSNKLIMEKE